MASEREKVWILTSDKLPGVCSILSEWEAREYANSIPVGVTLRNVVKVEWHEFVTQLMEKAT